MFIIIIIVIIINIIFLILHINVKIYLNVFYKVSDVSDVKIKMFIKTVTFFF
jgi:hypothetical protein